MFIDVFNLIPSFVLIHSSQKALLMSLYSLAGIDLPSAEILAKQLASINLCEQVVACCGMCKRKGKKEDLLILVNY